MSRGNREPTPEQMAKFAHLEDDDAAWEEYITRPPKSLFGLNFALVIVVLIVIGVIVSIAVNF